MSTICTASRPRFRDVRLCYVIPFTCINASDVSISVNFRCKSSTGVPGERAAVRDSASDAEPVPGHAAGWPCPKDPVLWPTQERILLRQEPSQLRRHLVLLPEWREAEAACQRTAGRLLGGDQILRAGGIRHQQIQVRTLFNSPTRLSVVATACRRRKYSWMYTNL